MNDDKRAARILAALAKRPGLYFELLVQAGSLGVLGPWEPPHEFKGTRHERASVGGGFAGWVHEEPDGKIWWTVICGPRNPEASGIVVESVEEGKRAVDTHLRKQGVLLAGDIWGRQPGPWMYEDGSPRRAVRYAPEGDEVAVIEEQESGHWYFTLVGPSSGIADTMDEAKHEADRRLRQRGWLL